VQGIRPASSILFLAGWSLSLACAKGEEIDRADIVILSLLPAPAADAGADAGAATDPEIVADPPVE
jgi:hypothetical protein